MASSASFLFLILCGHGVQGTNMELASLIQTRMDSHAQAPWRAQAQAFMGLLQSMGKQVPGEKQAETTRMLNELIAFLTTSSSDLKTSSQTAVTALQKEITSHTSRVNEYDQLAVTTLASTRTKDGELATCYADLRTKNDKYQRECQPMLPISECTMKDATKKKNFTVSKKATWQCNFHDGETADSCTNSASKLQTDLKAKNVSLETAYLEWVELRDECQRKTTLAQTSCETQRKELLGADGKKNACDLTFRETSELICDITTYAKTREEFSTSLTTKTEEARLKVAWKEEKKQWEDLQLIICVFKRFRTNMNFAQEDYATCQSEVDLLPFIPAPTVPDEPVTEVIDGVKFGGGLSDKYLGMPDAQDIPALSTKEVALNLHLPLDSSEAKMYLKLADTADQQSCKVAGEDKLTVESATLEAAEKECAASPSCKFFEFGSGKSRMGNMECFPQAETDSSSHYTIMRKVCNGGVRNE